jgi:uncharacterized protein (TIGR02246 family)
MQPPPSTLEPIHAQVLQRLAMRWQNAWNCHDMEGFAVSIAPDIDFVTVAGLWLCGRAEFLDHHRMLHRTQMRESRWTTVASTARLARAGFALQHVQWCIEGDRDPDGAPRSQRCGVFTWVVSLDAEPSIFAAHNTNLAAHVTHRLMPRT